ncbi:unnamed protein product, partial [Meganyctiphanes norvegica]
SRVCDWYYNVDCPSSPDSYGINEDLYKVDNGAVNNDYNDNIQGFLGPLPPNIPFAPQPSHSQLASPCQRTHVLDSFTQGCVPTYNPLPPSRITTTPGWLF